MNNIYEITDGFIQTFSQLQSMKEDITPECIENTLGGLSAATAKDLGGCLKEVEAKIAQMKEYEERMKEKRLALTKRLEAYYKYIANGMEECGYKELTCPEFTISLRSNPEAVVIHDGAIIPSHFHRQKITLEPDKLALKKALREGVKIDGVELVQRKRVVIE